MEHPAMRPPCSLARGSPVRSGMSCPAGRYGNVPARMSPHGCSPSRPRHRTCSAGVATPLRPTSTGCFGRSPPQAGSPNACRAPRSSSGESHGEYRGQGRVRRYLVGVIPTGRLDVCAGPPRRGMSLVRVIPGDSQVRDPRGSADSGRGEDDQWGLTPLNTPYGSGPWPAREITGRRPAGRSSTGRWSTKCTEQPRSAAPPSAPRSSPTISTSYGS